VETVAVEFGWDRRGDPAGGQADRTGQADRGAEESFVAGGERFGLDDGVEAGDGEGLLQTAGEVDHGRGLGTLSTEAVREGVHYEDVGAGFEDVGFGKFGGDADDGAAGEAGKAFGEAGV